MQPVLADELELVTGGCHWWHWAPATVTIINLTIVFAFQQNINIGGNNVTQVNSLTVLQGLLLPFFI